MLTLQEHHVDDAQRHHRGGTNEITDHKHLNYDDKCCNYNENKNNSNIHVDIYFAYPIVYDKHTLVLLHMTFVHMYVHFQFE